MPDPQQVRAMFGRIAPRYDLLNRALSLGIDQRWRKRVVKLAVDRGIEANLLDACCGSGDLTLAFTDAGVRSVGLDFTPELLQRAEIKRLRAKSHALGSFALADALRIPSEKDRFDAATVAFGLRNLADRRLGLLELARVVRPGGWVFVLEFQVPRGRLGKAYQFYFERALPRIGRVVSRDSSAYTYLRDTVLAWPTAEALQDEMSALGFDECGFERLTLGIVAIHWGRVPDRVATRSDTSLS